VVQHSEDMHVIAPQDMEHDIRETPQVGSTRVAMNGCVAKRLFDNALESSIDSLQEFQTQAGPLRLVPLESAG
jgi:hypothetical protein